MMQDFKTIDEFVRFLETVPADLFTSESSYESLDDDDSSDDAFDDCCHSCATLSCWPKSYNDPTIDQIDYTCCSLFILGNGKCNWNNINKIREYGYEVRAGEEDSFGWLTGILEFPDGRQVVYG